MKILFICTHNRCRSILAEAISNHLSRTEGSNRIEARSAGSQPAGEVHPLSLHYLKLHNVDTQVLQSQPWDDFEHWSPDVVITVCDSAAGEQCPVWFGNAVRIHWGLKDPSKLADQAIYQSSADDDAIAQAFGHTIAIIKSRIRLLLSKPFETWEQGQLIAQLEQLESIN